MSTLALTILMLIVFVALMTIFVGVAFLLNTHKSHIKPKRIRVCNDLKDHLR